VNFVTVSFKLNIIVGQMTIMLQQKNQPKFELFILDYLISL